MRQDERSEKGYLSQAKQEHAVACERASHRTLTADPSRLCLCQMFETEVADIYGLQKPMSGKVMLA